MYICFKCKKESETPFRDDGVLECPNCYYDTNEDGSMAEPDKGDETWDSVNDDGSHKGQKKIVGFDGNNPWSHKYWNVTEQLRVFNEYPQETANRLARIAGTKVIGGERPAPSNELA